MALWTPLKSPHWPAVLKLFLKNLDTEEFVLNPKGAPEIGKQLQRKFVVEAESDEGNHTVASIPVIKNPAEPVSFFTDTRDVEEFYNSSGVGII